MDSSIYNHLITTYTPRELTKYDTHKPSELKSIVNKIAKLANESPTYLIKLSDAKQSYALGVKESAMKIHESIEELSDSSREGVFYKKKAFSSDAEKAEALIITDDMERLPEQFTLRINKLATTQINMSEQLNPVRLSLEGGTYKFRAKVADDVYDFQYNIKKQATNGEVMDGLASFINKANIGINVHIEDDEESRRRHMILESAMTGSVDGEPIFVFSDINSEKTGLTKYFGLNNIVSSPSGSSFFINGEEKHTLMNEFTIGKALRMKLKDSTGEDEISVVYHSDSEQILDRIRKFADAYNYMVDSTEEYGKTTKDYLKLVKEMKQVMKPYTSEMESCGISISEDDRMSLDEALAIQAIDDGEMQKLFGEESDFVDKLLKKTDEIKLNPMDYVDKVTVTYPNYNSKGEGYSYITSLYSGMLFNYYC